MNRLFKTGLLVTATTALLTSLAADARMYRFADENGQMVISSSIPSEASNRGYEILSDSGRVIETIDPAPTEEQLSERARAKELEREQTEQLQSDTKLLRRFSHPDSAVRAMHRKLQEMRSLTRLKQSNINVIINQLDEEQSRAADLERSGRDIPQATLNKIDRLQSRIRELEREIKAQTDDVTAVREKFLQDIQRLEAITDEKRTLPLDRADLDNARNL
ncbi:MAG: DUF4124 domain-containing protein [Oleiphilaceae bacterium]|nr:DUF4124 domain-containing protein [Oleiphilaceae bacterium]